MTKKPLVTILIPQYKTLTITKLCLNLIQKFTPLQEVRILVIDNHSQDESTDYLRSLSFIELLERQREPDDSPPLAHARALDLALERVDTPYVLSIHSDTMIKHEQWLDFLLEPMKADPTVAGVGSWKLECKPWYQRVAKWVERGIQLAFYHLIHHKNHAIQGAGKNDYYLRSHCALFRTDILKKHHLTFSAGQENAGKVMCQRLKELGYRVVFLPSSSLGRYVEHLNHATTVLHPELGSRAKSLRKGNKRLALALERLQKNDGKNLDKLM